MDIDTMKQLIKKYEPGHAAFVTRADIAERYYRNETDILFRDQPKDKEKRKQTIHCVMQTTGFPGTFMV